MKHFLFYILLILAGYSLSAQPLIHSHNDYEQPKPFTNALQHKVFSVEADLYLRNNQLVLAHDPPAVGQAQKDVPVAPTLDSLYLQPIIRLFKKYHGRISKNKTYAPVLMIDVKEKGAEIIARLIKETAVYPSVFDRSVNPLAVQLVISGERGLASSWSSWPSFILFDGRPYEVYDSAALQRVAFISDVYFKYVTKTDSTSKIEQVVKKVHGMGKLLRLWAIPDNKVSWGQLRQLGVDIINTGKVEDCRKYFLK